MNTHQLKYLTLAGIFAIPFVPLFVSTELFFPFITSKAFLFRLLVQVIFASYLVLCIRDSSFRPKLNRISVSVLVFVLAIFLADIFSVNPIKSFWSNFERMEGFVGLIHFAIYFFIVSNVLKTKEIWLKLFSTSLFASMIMSIYSLFQIFGKFPINQGGVRVDGLLGNASYLAIYLVFHIFFAILVYLNTQNRNYKIFLFLLSILNIIILYYTATRGAMLGFIGGLFISFITLLFNSSKGDYIRKIAVSGLCIILVFSGLFIAFKDNGFIKDSPVLSRFASLSLDEVKTQGRYFIWPMAIKGFIENPIFGWGQESFNFVFAKYYNPEMVNQEPWFDRAHNTFLDWLVVGGSLGFLSYIFMIIFTIFSLFKINNNILNTKEKAVLAGLLSAYLFNNLFVFDQTSSYILFFTFIAFISFLKNIENETLFEKINNKLSNLKFKEESRPIFESGILIGILLIIYFVTYVPFRQNTNLYKILQLNNQNQVASIDLYKKLLESDGLGFSESLEHISQSTINMLKNPNIPNDFKSKIFDVVNEGFQKQLNMTPEDIRYRTFYAVFWSKFGWYGRAIEELNLAKNISPKKQTIYFELINNLILDNKLKEAFEIAKYTYELEPDFYESKIIYALTAYLVGDIKTGDIVFAEMDQIQLVFDDRYLSVLANLNMNKKVFDTVKKRIEFEPNNLNHYITLTASYLQFGNRGEAIKTLELLIEKEPNFKEKGEYYISEIKAGRNP